MPFDRITIINATPPTRADINSELQWLGAALGLFGERDKNSSCFRVFIALVRATHADRTLTSDEIATQTDLTRGTVVHHLHKLSDTGLVEDAEHGYTLHGDDLHDALTAIRDSVHKRLDLLEAVAKDIDEKLR